MTDHATMSRRQAGALLAGFALSPVALRNAGAASPTVAGKGAAPAGAAAAGAAPALDWVFDLDVKVGAAQELGEAGGGRRRVIPITGGGLTGPRMAGEVLPGGADWQTLRADGVTLLQARYTVRMPDGAVIGIINTGVRRASPEVARRLAGGELVDPSLYYFRASPVFEVGPGPYAWLTENLFVSVGQRLPDLVRLKVYQVG
jgi:hypothetical protein